MSRKSRLILVVLGLIGAGAALKAVAQQGRPPARSGAGTTEPDPRRPVGIPARQATDRVAPQDPAGAGTRGPALERGRSGQAMPPRAGGRRGGTRSGVQSANVSVEIVGPASASAGVPAQYELVVRNEGDNAVENVRVEAELPEACEFVSATPEAEIDADTAAWLLERLEPADERRIKMQLRPLGEGMLECHALVTCTALSGVQTVVTRPQLALSMTGPREVVAGEPVEFKLTISNPGTGPATNVLVRDAVPAGLAHEFGNEEELEYEVGTLGPGESREVQLELKAVGAGVQTNHAEVTADGGLRAAAESTVRVLQAQLKLTKTGPKRRYLDRQGTYSLELSNPGTAPARNVVVVDELPDGFAFVEAGETAQLSQDRKTVRWSLKQLDPSDSRVFTVTLRAVEAGEYCAVAQATADGGLRAEAEACTAVEGISALLLEVVDLADPIEVGADTTYEVRVVNQGSQAATNLLVRAVAPRGLEPLEADGPVGYQIRGQEILFEPLPRLGVRADAAYHIHVRGQRAGDLRFRVSMQCDQLEAAVNKEESTRVFADE